MTGVYGSGNVYVHICTFCTHPHEKKMYIPKDSVTRFQTVLSCAFQSGYHVPVDLRKFAILNHFLGPNPLVNLNKNKE